MIRKSKDLRRTSQEKLRDGVGFVDMVHFLEEDQSYNTGRLFAIATIPPGSSIGKHTHEGNYEVYYILKGTAHVTDNGEPGVLEAGDMMLCKNGDNHSIENRGTEPVEALFLVIYVK